MKVLRCIDFAKQPSLLAQGAVVTIGNFDGVHLGHQAIFAEVKAEAQRCDLPAVVVFFEPQPLEFFAAVSSQRLCSLRDKLKYIGQHGIDVALVLSFDQDLSRLSAEDFVQQVLHNKLNAKHVVVGSDFRFGAKRSGDITTLQNLGQRLGFSVAVGATVDHNGQRVSSTLLRQALKESDFNLAAQLLGRDYEISGRVVHGDARGRTLGFETANIALKRPSALHGVYSVQCCLQEQQAVLHGIANIGQRPTIGGLKWLLEVHLFDFNSDIYGQHLSVRFLHKVRDEKRFASLDELKQQIALDVSQARDFFRRNSISK